MRMQMRKTLSCSVGWTCRTRTHPFCTSTCGTTCDNELDVNKSTSFVEKKKEISSFNSSLLAIPFVPHITTTAGISLSEPTGAVGVAATANLAPTLVAFLKIAPPIAAQLVSLSPLAAMKQFKADGTTGDVSCIPYAAMCANGALWVTYGALKGDMTIIVPNMSGFFLGAYYVRTFAKYAPPDISMTPYISGITALIGSVLGMAASLETAAAIDAIGLSGCAVVAVMFGGPLGSIKTVLKNKNTNSLPVPFTVAAFVNCFCWVSYGSLIIDDIYVWGPNLAGLMASSAQLGLYAKFGLPK